MASLVTIPNTTLHIELGFSCDVVVVGTNLTLGVTVSDALYGLRTGSQ
jgi:hypothetical protein